MLRRLTFITTGVFLFLSAALFMFCTEPLNPMKMDENARITLDIEKTAVHIGDTAVFDISLYLTDLVQSVHIDYGDGTHDTVEISAADSLFSIKHLYTLEGEMRITATAYTQTVSKTASLRIEIVRPAQLLSNGAITTEEAPREGTPLKLSVTARGTPQLIYTWYKDSTAIPNNDNATFIISTLEKADTGSYFCVVSNLYGKDTSLIYSVRLSEQLPPTIQNSRNVLTSGAVELDSKFHLFVNVSGSENLAFQWYKDDEKFTGEQKDTLTFNSLQLSDNGSYYCVVSNDFGTATSSTFQLRVNQPVLPPTFLHDKRVLTEGSAKLDSTFSLLIEIEDEAAAAFKWFKDDSALDALSGSVLLFESLQLSDTGDYYCVVTNDAGSDTSLTYSLRVGQNLPPTIQSKKVFSKGENEPDSSFALYVNASGTPTLSYHWYKDGFLLGDETGDSLRFSALSLSDSGTYYCIVENSHGKDTSELYELTVLQRGYVIVLKSGTNGTITPNSENDTVEVQEGDTLVCTFMPDDGYRVGEVLIDGEPENAAVVNNEYTFTDIAGDHSFEVVFEKIMYKVTITTTGNGDVTTDPSVADSIAHGTELSITATAKDGNYFSGWAGKASGGDNPLILMVKDNLEISAIFAQIGRYTVNVSIDTAEGQYTIEPEQDDYEEGETVTLVAAPKAGYSFLGWSGIGTSSSDSLEITVTPACSLVAEFDRLSYTISASSETGGQISPSGGIEVLHGEDAMFTIGADVGYRIDSVKVDGQINENADDGYTFTNVSANHSIKLFVSKQRYSLDAIKETVDNGTVSGDITKNPEATFYEHGTVVSVKAPANDKYVFKYWKSSRDSIGEQNPIEVEILGPQSIIAYYEIKQVELSANVSPQDYGSVSPSGGKYNIGSSVSLTASPNEGYRFDSWTDDAGGSNSTTTITMDSDKSVTANFSLKPPQISQQPTSDSVYEGESITFTIQASGVDLLYQWQKDGVNILNEESSQITVSDSGTYRCIVTNEGGIDTSIDVRLSYRTTVTDIDGNVYPIVRIGNQLWTTVNLRVTRYNDSTDIPHIEDSIAWANIGNGNDAYCYYENTTERTEQEKHGALYTWYAVNTGKLAPEGWKVPSGEDWAVLEDYLIVNGYHWDDTTSDNKIAKSLASRSDWESSSRPGDVGNDLASNNSTGFTAFPSGTRINSGGFGGKNSFSAWWTSTEAIASSSHALDYYLHNIRSYLLHYEDLRGTGMSVRLVREVN